MGLVPAKVGLGNRDPAADMLGLVNKEGAKLVMAGLMLLAASGCLITRRPLKKMPQLLAGN